MKILTRTAVARILTAALDCPFGPEDVTWWINEGRIKPFGYFGKLPVFIPDQRSEIASVAATGAYFQWRLERISAGLTTDSP